MDGDDDDLMYSDRTSLNNEEGDETMGYFLLGWFSCIVFTVVEVTILRDMEWYKRVENWLKKALLGR